MSADPDSIPLQLIPQAGGGIPVAPQVLLISYLKRFKGELMRSARAHSLLIALILIYWAITMAVASWLAMRPLTYFDGFDHELATITGLYFGVLFISYVIYIMVAVHPGRLSLYLWRDLTSRILTIDRLCTVLPAALLLPILISSYSSFKREIPLLNPYHWDPALAHLGRVLFGGHQSWEWLQPLLGHPWITWSLNFIYNSWFFVFFGVLFWQMTSMSRPRLRMQYLTAVVLQWALLGSLLATLVSSAGPAFYGRLTGGEDPYASLLHYLRSVDPIHGLWAVQTQDFLWRCHVNKDLLAGCGLSAMPSMHVATAFGFVMLGFATNRWLGSFFAVYCVFIFIASVHLGWHYASDGIVGMIGALLVWCLTGWILERRAVRNWLGDTL